MARKRRQWRGGEAVIFNDMGNWGMGLVESEGEPSESSRWYWVLVREGTDPLAKRRRLVRADDLIPFDEALWETIKSDLERLGALEGEKRGILRRLRTLFAPPEADDDAAI